MAGSPGKVGNAVAGLLSDRERLIRLGSSVLDVGCGAGALAIALGARGARVTALDDSPGMIAALEHAAGRRRVAGIRTRLCSWSDFAPSRSFDLVGAASFPAAWSPDGLRRLEGWSRSWCVLTLGIGGDPFPFRSMLWKTIMGYAPVPRMAGGRRAQGRAGDAPPERTLAAQFLFNYLLCSGRRPNLVHIELPMRLDVGLERAVNFYSAYFGIFGKERTRTERTIRDVLSTHARDARLRAQGPLTLAVLWWRVPEVRPAALSLDRHGLRGV